MLRRAREILAEPGGTSRPDRVPSQTLRTRLTCCSKPGALLIRLSYLFMGRVLGRLVLLVRNDASARAAGSPCVLRHPSCGSPAAVRWVYGAVA
jgi:hypothetical protein